ncbi:flippase [Ligilactobacillus equi]|uniref:EpsN n=1 Tax=Ligilactobacillus equi DPC 6820 TaxID=1392007 RepID=V7HX61_9LACO|nr:flippase [Ligilactobacillus equi]ETA74472.1 EpsN [Ligilactobacillus equi DPC 6820]
MIKIRNVKYNAIINVIKEMMTIIFPMITFPYATRVLGVVNYGKYTFSASIVNYISYVAAAGILRYAVRECARLRDDKKKMSLLIDELFTINIITTLFAYIILALLLSFWSKMSGYAPIILIISLSVLFTTLGTDWINTAHEDYFFIAIRYIFSQTIALILMFVLVRNQNDILGYAFVSILGSLLANLANYWHIRKTYHIYPKIRISCALKKHFKPIAYLFASTIATFIYINSDVTMLGIFKSDKIVGYYGVSSRFYTMVKQVLNAAFVVVIPRIARNLEDNREETGQQLNRILNLTMLLGFPATVGLFMVRKDLIILFAGEEYLNAVSSLGILSIAIIPALLANFFINIVLIPLKQEKIVMIATMISAAVNIVLNLLLIPVFAENGAAITTLIAELILTVIGAYYAKGVLGNNFYPILVSILGSALIILVCLVINLYITNVFFNVILCIIFGCLIYAIVLLIFRNKLFKER